MRATTPGGAFLAAVTPILVAAGPLPHARLDTGGDASSGPVMVADKKIAWPAQLSIGPDGMGNSLEHIKEIMGTSMEALIHHFKLVTEGFTVPEGEAYSAVESPRGELGCYVVADGSPKPRRVHMRDPSFVNLQATADMCRDSLIADMIATLAMMDPILGGVDR